MPKRFTAIRCGNCGREVTCDPSPSWIGGPHCPNCGADLSKRRPAPAPPNVISHSQCNKLADPARRHDDETVYVAI